MPVRYSVTRGGKHENNCNGGSATFAGSTRDGVGGYNEGLAAAEAGDYATALREWWPLAEQGNAYAQFYLGTMYERGHGVPQDYKEAVKWYRKAAEQGPVEAQNNLGGKYQKGRGVPQNYKEAVKWYCESAEQGFAMAQNNLGIMYRDGLVVPQDYVQAHKWFYIAGSNGFELGTSNRDEITKRMTPVQIAEA